MNFLPEVKTNWPVLGHYFFGQVGSTHLIHDLTNLLNFIFIIIFFFKSNQISLQKSF